ncbi:hypothetical protein N9C48_00325 [bacterium]|jgi:hypothetical protein|nr:hypothetical protein [bacterium]MDA9938535.1 hypothetical protein [bacterium]|tara:strand:+ start:260 stop:1096 length:837 start_codon:yes stop_codon:yes gene_type:complete
MPNFILVAQNTQDVNYVKQACALAMSIHATTPNSNISILTDDAIPERYKPLFDNVIEIPWGDLANKYDWKIHNRWKTYFISPYDDAIVLDTDMLVLEDITTWYNFLQNYDMYITSTVFDYRGNKIKDTFYRKNFNKYNLPNTYMGLHYFKKSDFALEFYTWLDKITNNWEEFYKLGRDKPIQNFASMDLTAAMTIDLLDCKSKITNENVSVPSFTHMKANIQGWDEIRESWQTKVGTYFTNDAELYIGNHKQSGIFHYTEDNFLTDDIIQVLETRLDI